ncbi:hypothetical protein [Microscilla marina]|uniref:Lipoprotein n=1 Tax=Microscilla marina ATCC 23134 TaxID=313606 RepID=A1ZM22_MICM2|nr:hypothetical protein [Microscilla marina]EAY28554.1 hypothetical protein M23134_04401 [Microscilla marina ATCC 23134]
MKKKLITICVVLCLVGSAFGQRHKVSVSFVKDGKEVALKGDFKIYLVFKDSLKTLRIEPTIKDNYFTKPVIAEGKKWTVIFQYKKHLIGFEQPASFKGLLSYGFGVDCRPFTKEHKQSAKDFKPRKIRRIHYFKPYYGGDGMVHSRYISKIKANKNRILKLIE